MNEPIMRFKLSLAHLFLGVTAWAVYLGAILAWFPDWVYATLSLAAIVAKVVLVARKVQLGAVAWLALPLFCLLNWSLFVIALGYVFGERNATTLALGPLAKIVSLPVVWIQNSMPLARPWDTLVGIAVVSLLETAALIMAISVVRRRFGSPRGEQLL